MEAFSNEQAKRMLDAMAALHDSMSDYNNDHLGRTFPNAPMNDEIKSMLDSEIIKTAYCKGTLLIEVAADHLIAFTKTVTNPVQTFAPWVAVRGVLEASALSAWLLDPGIKAEDRARRTFALTYEGLIGRIKYLEACLIKESYNAKATDIQALIQAQAKQTDEVEVNAIRLGFEKIEDKNGKRIGIGMKMPSVTHLICLVFDDVPAFRLLSAVAHCHDWALIAVGLKEDESDDGKSEFVKLKKHISAEFIEWLSARALRAFARPVWYKSRQCGWDMVRLGNILESAYDAMSLVETERFWRSTVVINSPTGPA